jgi:CDP-paratose 2-epimerase
MRILVTGACGFVGSTLIRELRSRHPEYSIVGLDNFLREGSRGNREPLEGLGVRVEEGDIRSAADLDRVGAADWVVDCAAEPSVLAGVQGNTSSFGVMDHNLIGTIQLLEFCKRQRAGFVLLSTSRVYSIKPLAGLAVEAVDGGFRPQRFLPEIGLTAAGISERFPTSSPISLYGASKLCSETLALEYGDAFGFPVWINRCGVLAGAGQFGRADQGIYSFWIRSWRDGLPLRYIGFDGRGSQVRDCLHPRDLVPLLHKQLSGTKPTTDGSPIDLRICNFAGGTANACSLAQLSAWCRDHFGNREVACQLEPRPYDLPWVVLDAGRAKRLWDWQPFTPLATICKEIAAT